MEGKEGGREERLGEEAERGEAVGWLVVYVGKGKRVLRKWVRCRSYISKGLETLVHRGRVLGIVLVHRGRVLGIVVVRISARIGMAFPPHIMPLT